MNHKMSCFDRSVELILYALLNPIGSKERKKKVVCTKEERER